MTQVWIKGYYVNAPLYAAVAKSAAGGQVGRFSRRGRPHATSQRRASSKSHMIHVYLIRSLKTKYNYAGITNDLEKRLLQHNLGYNKSTKPFAPFETILVENYEDYKEARKREKFLKSGQGREWIRKSLLK